MGAQWVQTLGKSGSNHIQAARSVKKLISHGTVFKSQSLLLKEQHDIIHHLRSRIPTWFCLQSLRETTT